MGLYNLDKIFKPASIAVVGASNTEGSVGWALLKNLADAGFEGKIFPVNPNHEQVQSLRSHPSIGDIGEPVDLALIAVPIDLVPEVIDACAENRVGGAIVVSAGGKEAGEKGRELERRIEKTAREGGVRLLGPNCLGIICPGRNLNASFAPHMPYAGKLAFLSQSGAICTSILDLSMKERFGFSYFVSTGSMADVDFGDLIDYLGHDWQVKSILLYVESLTHFRKFMSAARAVSRIKPIVILKSGKSRAGAEAAASHTGAMAGSDDAYGAAFERAGIVRVETIGDLFDCAELVAKQPRPHGSRLAIITNGGGPGVMAADELARYDATPAALSDDTLDRLNEILPAAWSHGNPVDVIGDTPPEIYAQAVEICMSAKEVDGVLALFSPQALTRPARTARELVERLHGRNIPVITSWMGGTDVEEARSVLNQADIPTYDTPEEGIRAFMYLHQYARNLEMLQEIPPRLSRDLAFDAEAAGKIIQPALEEDRATLSEPEAKDLLAAYGIPVNPTRTAGSEEAAVEAAAEIGYPVVLKILSPDISHKTDAGGVKLGLRDDGEVRAAYAEIMDGAGNHDPDAALDGVTVQPMLPRAEHEILMGAKVDENFGPVILFGLGGIYAEVLKDRAVGLPPLNRALARRMMERTRLYTLLSGYRGRKADLEAIEEMLIRLSQLTMDFPGIAELDMNPVIVTDGKPMAVDARVILRKTAVEPRRHLVISPYPARYEFQKTVGDGMEILVRPIKPEDAPLFTDLFETLSEKSVYTRFFRHVKQLSQDMIARFTQIDYDREMALVAVRESNGDREMMGVARIIGDPDGVNGEFSVVVGDPWHGKGVGGTLLEACLKIMKERGMKRVWGAVLPENTGMIKLGKKLGFEAERNTDTDEYELTIDLADLET